MKARVEGTTFKRCACRTPEGRLVGAGCAKLRRATGGWSSTHGSWGYQIELPRTAGGTRRQARRVGIGAQSEALEELAHIRTLLGIAADDEQAAVRIADAIQSWDRLPTLDEARRLVGSPEQRAQTPTLGAWLNEWLNGKTGLAQSTRGSYQGHIDNHIVPAIGWVRLDRLNVGHVQTLFEQIVENNDRIEACRASDDPEVRASVRGQRVTGAATRQRIRATLRSALSSAVARRDLPAEVNVAAQVELASAPRVKPMVWTASRVEHYMRTGQVPSPVMVWTPEQTAIFLRRARRDRLYPLFHLTALKGLRRGEAVGLPWAETRLRDGAIDIRWQVVQLGWKTMVSRPKSDAGQRTISLDAETAWVLKAWRKRQAAERLKAGQKWVESGRVFTHADGSGLHPAWVSHLFQRIAAEAGLPPIGLHGLRHGAASLSLAAGVDVKVVSAELGHSTAYFTQDTYQSVFPETARAAAEATAAMIPLKATQSRNSG